MAEALLDDAPQEGLPASTGPTLVEAPVDTPAVAPVVADTPAPVAEFPADWRERIAGDDAKYLAELHRFTDPKALAKSWKETRTLISSGKYKSELPADATEAEVAEWRKQNGVPESPDKYELALPPGIELTDDDKPIVDSYLKYAHENNIPASNVNASLGWYYALVDAQAKGEHEADIAFRAESEAALKKEWGHDYQANLNAVDLLISDPDLKGQILSARDQNGRLLGDNPAIMAHFAQLARQVYPAHSLIPSNATNSIDALESEISAIRKDMANPTSGYFKDAKKQARYIELVDARERLKSRQ